jgi:hypothetical protein
MLDPVPRRHQVELNEPQGLPESSRYFLKIILSMDALARLPSR